jgi:hypothetical protein
MVWVVVDDEPPQAKAKTRASEYQGIVLRGSISSIEEL